MKVRFRFVCKIGYWWSRDERVRRLRHEEFFRVREWYEGLTGSGRIKMEEMVGAGKLPRYRLINGRVCLDVMVNLV